MLTLIIFVIVGISIAKMVDNKIDHSIKLNDIEKKIERIEARKKKKEAEK